MVDLVCFLVWLGGVGFCLILALRFGYVVWFVLFIVVLFGVCGWVRLSWFAVYVFVCFACFVCYLCMVVLFCGFVSFALLLDVSYCLAALFCF